MFFQSTAIVILLLFYGCYYMKLKIAFLQLLPGAAIALFPEMWSSGYVFPHDEEWLKKNSVSLDSAYVKRFSGLAREFQMAIAITLLEKHEANPRNTVCLFDRHGKLVYRYSKVHIFFWSRTLIFLTPPSRKISALPESFSTIRISA